MNETRNGLGAGGARPRSPARRTEPETADARVAAPRLVSVLSVKPLRKIESALLAWRKRK